MSENNKFFSWVKTHQTELIIAGVTIIGTVLIVRNWDSIKGRFKVTKSIVPDGIKIEPVEKETVVPLIPSNILDDLTGNRLTARALGDKV